LVRILKTITKRKTKNPNNLNFKLLGFYSVLEAGIEPALRRTGF